MREIVDRFTVYKFDELSPEAQQKALENLWDINVDYEWWDSTYDDAWNIDLKIKEFDLDRGSYVKAVFMGSAMDTAEKILQEHGEHCDTYKTASDYMVEYKKLVFYQCQDDADAISERDFDYIINTPSWDIETDEIDDEFLRSLCEDYRIILQNEYEYLTSEEAIKDTIEANEYEFHEDGRLWDD